LKQEAAVAADKDNRKADASRSEDPIRDNADGSSRRDLVPVSAPIPNKPLIRSRPSDSLFVAHLFATRFQEPQTREKRRADPADANASYRKSAKRPAKTGRYLSKKI
jgi:hypothetical protein